jgi:hypothetical protein
MVKKKNRVYDDVRQITEVPSSKRVLVKNCRKKMIKPRRYHHTDKTAVKARLTFIQLKELMNNVESEKLAGKDFYIPYRPTGPYCGAVMALYLLGVNKFHELYIIKNMMQEFMSRIGIDDDKQSSWDRFSDKLPKNNAVDVQDLNGRIISNMAVLQRLGGHNPCGNKLAEIGCCIDIKKNGSGRMFYRLNTNFDIKTMDPLIDRSEYIKTRSEERLKETDKEFSKKVKKLKKNINKENEELLKEVLEKRVDKEETTLT